MIAAMCQKVLFYQLIEVRRLAEEMATQRRGKIKFRVSCAPAIAMPNIGGEMRDDEICIGITPIIDGPKINYAHSVVLPWSEWERRPRRVLNELFILVERSIRSGR